ncbi:MAG TPA: serine/threonine-protein kinase [Kofleriaceae bacterium]|nr:serine/threonine-protein kinase [Kofleriaceae bacterium]
MGFRPDDRIGNYRVEAELGPTGWGLLVQAQHIVLPRRAIIKVVHTPFAAIQPFVLQTLREACILEAIAHPGVPMVYESGVLRDRRPWFALEMIAGPTLEDLLACGPLSLIEVAGLLRDVSDILEHAHRRGVIHRALVPERIVLTGERRFPLCVPDWSEAMAHDATSHLPEPPAAGPRSYAAPELARRDDGARPLIDDRVDMFALGAIAYRALTGCMPFDLAGEGDDDGVYVRARERRPEAPFELAALVDSLLSYDRFDRPTAAEVRADVEWLFDTLPDLRARTTTRRESPPPPPSLRPGTDESIQIGIGTGVQRDAAAVRDYARGTTVLPRVHEDVLLDHRPRLRRPKWTPDVRYLESTYIDVEGGDEVGDDERVKK